MSSLNSFLTRVYSALKIDVVAFFLGGGHKNQLSIVFLCLPIFALRFSGRGVFRFTLSKKVVLSIPRFRES